MIIKDIIQKIFHSKKNENKVEKNLKSILHVWDIAGISAILAKYLKKRGYKADVILREGYDKFNILSFYEIKTLELRGKQFLKHAVKMAKDYDIIHIHDLFELVPLIQKKYKNEKTIILHYHGTRLRNTPQKERFESEKIADNVIVSTKDLQKILPTATYLPNSIDIEFFHGIPQKENVERKFIIKNEAYNWKLISNRINALKLGEVEIIDRQTQFVPYSKMPELFGKFTTYVDIKYQNGELLDVFSTTAMQALACGLTVIDGNGKKWKEFPEEHKPENVIEKLLSIYFKK